jgi:hypothetical protein
VPIDSDPDMPDPDTPDRARETPAAPDRQGAPDAKANPETPGSRERQISEHARYQRVVEAAYQAAAEQRWASAVPELRAAWEEHREKFPERTRPAPQAKPDGGWSADASRRLTPEQNAEAAKACADLRDEAEEVILPAMQRVEAASPDGRLAGLDHMLKGEDRLKEKIAEELLAKPGKTVREAMTEVADPVRFTLSYPPQRYAGGVATDVDRLKAEGFELIKLKNLWPAEQYKGINSQWRRPDTGTRFEMQFHTFESLEAKELTHAAYERIRGSDASPAERRELKAFQLRVNTLLVTPPATAEIKDFPEKKRD